MPTFKTPGIYIQEINAFPNSVVEVATAVPAFVGHTAQACQGGRSLRQIPFRISSMAEFRDCFGAGPQPLFSIADHSDDKTPPDFVAGAAQNRKGYDLTQLAGKQGGRFLLYRSMLHFFMNGGGSCYVMSVGDFDTELSAQALQAGIDLMRNEPEPTLLVIPDAVLLAETDCHAVQAAMITHCGEQMRNRIAILDIWGGAHGRDSPFSDPIDRFRQSLGTEHLDFAAAYYPWLDTSLIEARELGFQSVDNRDKLAELLRAELGLPATADQSTKPAIAMQVKLLADLVKSDRQWAANLDASIDESIDESDIEKKTQLVRKAVDDGKVLLDKSLLTISPLFATILALAGKQLNRMPPAAAMAGVYTAVDNSRGVWKAPANVSLAGVVAPAVAIAAQDQDDLNHALDGKSINAIRTFAGQGVLVWGARTLAGNSLDWRYVNVRRTMIMIEQSCRLAIQAYIFEPNDASTWTTIKSMLENFLSDVWKRGGLAGAAPEDAYTVAVGLGTTMTGQDIQDQRLLVQIGVAITRPAEFIIIEFQQQMQQS